jgi:hypothetical protein
MAVGNPQLAVQPRGGTLRDEAVTQADRRQIHHPRTGYGPQRNLTSLMLFTKVIDEILANTVLIPTLFSDL